MVLRIGKGVPFVEVRLIKPKTRNDCWHWQVLKCPYCGAKHLHGAGVDPDTVNKYLSHRVAHCHRDKQGLGYNLGSREPPKLICLADVTSND